MAVAQDAAPAAAMNRERACATNSRAHLATQPEWPNMAWLASDSIDTSAAALWTAPAHRRSSLAFLQYTSGSTKRAQRA